MDSLCVMLFAILGWLALLWWSPWIGLCVLGLFAISLFAQAARS